MLLLFTKQYYLVHKD